MNRKRTNAKKKKPAEKSASKGTGGFAPLRDSNGKWLPGQSACPPDKRVMVKGNPWAWKKGQSGNPLTQQRKEFEEAFHRALMGQGSPNEAARLLWTAARQHQSWAVLALLQRIAPENSKVKLEVSRGQDTDGIDFAKLSLKDIEALEHILERANTPAIESSQSGEEP